MNSITEKIRSRGYWHRVFRPLPFNEQRVQYRDLYSLVQRTTVDYRGWGFPKSDRNAEPERGSNFVGNSFEWEDRLEAWRLYTSGQFISIQAFMLDWRESATYLRQELPGGPTEYLGLLDVVGSFTEFYDFAARLAMTEAGDERIRLSVVGRGLKGRRLISETPMRRLFNEYRTSAEELPYDVELSRGDLIAHPGELAAQGALNILEKFGGQFELDTIKGIQKDLMR